MKWHRNPFGLFNYKDCIYSNNTINLFVTNYEDNLFYMEVFNTILSIDIFDKAVLKKQYNKIKLVVQRICESDHGTL